MTATGRAAADVIISTNPYDGTVVAETPAATAADVCQALDASQRGWRTWTRRSTQERADMLRRFADLIERDAEQLTRLIVAETGKRVTEARDEVRWGSITARWYADHPPATRREADATVRTRPLGVIAVITPWNVALVTALWKLCPALIAGNAVIWKPSDHASATAVLTTALAAEAGVPADVLILLPGGRDIGAGIVADARVDGVHFTGSEPAGREIALVVAGRLSRCALELGGSNPVIVLDDADVSQAAADVAASMAAINGQKCTAVRRVIVLSDIAAAFEQTLADEVGELVPGDPRQTPTRLGPLISVGAAMHAEAEIQRCLRSGARLSARAESGNGLAAFRPAVLRDVPRDDQARTRELFAPVVLLDRAFDDAEALALANRTTFGLSAAVYSRNRGRATWLADRLEAGIVTVNRRPDQVALEAPFGGYKHSGNGVPEGGTYAYQGVGQLQATYADAC